MKHLSSCYFCGTALDELLQVYRVPESSGSGEETTITLCQTCRRKLDTVLDTAGGADLTTSSQGSTEEKASTAGESNADDILGDPKIDEPMEMTEPADTEPEDDESQPESHAVESDKNGKGVDEPGEFAQDSGDESADAEPDSAEDSEPESVNQRDNSSNSVDDIDDADDEQDISEGIRSEMEPDVPDDLNAPEFEGDEESTTADESSGETDTGAELAESTDEDDLGLVDDEVLTGEEDIEDEGTPETEETPTEEGTPEENDEPFGELDESEPETTATPEDETEMDVPDDDEGRSDTSAESGSDTTDENTKSDTGGEPPRTTISALEYNKVMRLLQNRKFPVERDEIETVAANAYDLADSDCAQVIDLAVDRGLLQEDEGQLYRPDDE